MPRFYWIRHAVVFVVLAFAWAVAIGQQNVLPALNIAGNMTTIELAPILVAVNGIYRGPVIVMNGGIPNLMRGEVDAATNAETQLLRQSIDDPSLRIILTEAESFYRIVARRSSGIASVKDLRGKKIAIAPYTSWISIASSGRAIGFGSAVTTSSSVATVCGRREAVRRVVRNVLRSTRSR